MRRGARRLGIVAATVLFAITAPLAADAVDPDAGSDLVLPAGEWLAGDLHVHSTYSHDSYGGPTDDNTGPEEFYTLGQSVALHFTQASTRGLDYLAITDHNDVRSHSDAGFGSNGVIGVRGYEASYHGHGQVLGVGEVLDSGDESSAAINAVAGEAHARGGLLQVNHPMGLDGPDWEYGYDVVPDSVEVWNINRLFQAPLPSASDNDEAIRYWEGWLDRGVRVAATGGSDTHWLYTSPLQGAGQPTTWVYADDRSETGVLAGIRAGRTFVSWQPPAFGGAQLFLEADADGDGRWESMVGDTVPQTARARVRVVGGIPGATVRVLGTGGSVVASTPIAGPDATVEFAAPTSSPWVRAELVLDDFQALRRSLCDPLVHDVTTYCRNQIAVLALTSALFLSPAPQSAVAVQVDGERVTLANGLVARTWSLAPFRTQRLEDLRTGRVWSTSTNDFRFNLDGLEIRGDTLAARAPPIVQRTGNGAVQLTFDLGIVRRVVTAYPGVAGFRSRTEVMVPGVLSSYTLDEAEPGTVAATVHSFRAGADWREPDWEPVAVGDANRGDWRRSETGAPGQPMNGTAQWLSAAAPDGASLFMVMERNDQPSSTMAYDGSRVAARVDLSRDVVTLGPFEETIHVQNPTPGPARVRVLTGPTTLESVFTGVALDRDDEPWQHYAYLHRFRNLLRTAPVVFNSDSVDENRISTGAKDDMDLAEVVRQAAVAKQLGAEVFVLDDGWQAISGDWCPDSPACPEPRAPRFPPRFPDSTFAAVREAIAPMRLGLWMTPMAFHPASQAFQRNPTWSCLPLGTATALPSFLTPDDGSFEAGIGLWNPLGVGADGRLIDHVESRIRTAIEQWGVVYFKFDFLAWIDCVGPEPVDQYRYRDAFVAMLDRLIADHPDVTFQIDETNDYRLFPFESIARGPSWFQNGAPSTPRLLHNLWQLAPWVPGATIGQHTYGGGERDERAARYLMAVALGSHLTFKSDLTTLTSEQITAAREAVDLYVAHRDLLGGFAYPLLDEPLDGTTWTALQPWDLDAQRGMVLVYRQDDPRSQGRVPLRGLRAAAFRVADARTGAVVGTFSRTELAGEGLPVSLPSTYEAGIFVVEPA